MPPVFSPAVFDSDVFDALLAFSFEGSIDLEVEVSLPFFVFSFDGTIDLEVEVDSEFHSVFDFTGTLDLDLEVEAGVTVHRLRVAGRTGIIIHKPDFSSPSGIAGPLEVFAWKTSRYQNKVGTWSASVPVDDQLIADDDDLDELPEPVTRQIERGWRVSIVQENNIPLDIISEGYLLFQGIVERREYAIDEASARLDLAGSMRNLVLAGRATRQGLSYDGTPTAAAIIDDLVGGVQHIGTPGGAIYPAALANRSPKVTFNDISKLAALLKFTELTRTAYRESWDYDRPEFTPIDGPPGIYTLVNVEAADPGLDDLASAGFGIIGGPPRVRYEGQEIVNRIIPIGSDTPDGDLTLEHSLMTEPFPIQSDLNPDGSTFWYIEDAASILRYGLVETKLIRTDVKNPSDNATTRQKSADVLYSVAAGELLKRRSEQIFVTVPVANGAGIWALPGDCIALEYSGWVEQESGRVAWMDIDRLFMVTERHDEGDASGIRGVELVLAAPAIEYPVKDLPNSIKNRPPLSLPPLVPPDDIDKILPKKTLKFKVSADCCDDIEIDVIEEIEPVPPTDEDVLPPPAGGTITPTRRTSAGIPGADGTFTFGPTYGPATYILLLGNATLDLLTSSDGLTTWALVHTSPGVTIGLDDQPHDARFYQVTVPSGYLTGGEWTRLTDLSPFIAYFHLYKINFNAAPPPPPGTVPMQFIEPAPGTPAAVNGNRLHAQDPGLLWSPPIPDPAYDVFISFSITV